MVSLTHHGMNFRTKPLGAEQAHRFAQCLSHNSRFTGVEVVESRSPGKWTVLYQPASEIRHAELLYGEHEKREARAQTEGAGYVFVLDDSRAFFWCASTSGEVYETTERSCNCPDHVYRTSRVGLRCKHQLALIQGVGEVRAW